jgi:hypothetical protein
MRPWCGVRMRLAARVAARVVARGASGLPHGARAARRCARSHRSRAGAGPPAARAEREGGLACVALEEALRAPHAREMKRSPNFHQASRQPQPPPPTAPPRSGYESGTPLPRAPPSLRSQKRAARAGCRTAPARGERRRAAARRYAHSHRSRSRSTAHARDKADTHHGVHATGRDHALRSGTALPRLAWLQQSELESGILGSKTCAKQQQSQNHIADRVKRVA